jgi:hypothetical protein
MENNYLLFRFVYSVSEMEEKSIEFLLGGDFWE